MSRYRLRVQILKAPEERQLPGVPMLSTQLSRQEWVARCAQEIEVLVPLRAEDRYEVLSPAFVNDWAAAIWTSSQGAEQPELAAWAAVKDAEIVWNKLADEPAEVTRRTDVPY